MYFGIHNHDEYSNITTGLDSSNKLSKMIARAQELGMAGLAITNHDNLCEVMNINDEQKKLREKNSDFTLAIGNEIYLIDKFVDDDKNTQKYYHFILIAKDKIGYDALIMLSSKAWYRSKVLRKHRRVPTEKADVEEVMKWAKGHLIASTACLGGELATAILEDRMDDAARFYTWCIRQFGLEDFYIELQPSDSEEQKIFNTTVISSPRFKDAKFVISTDAHYLSKEEFPIFEAFLRSEQEKREVKEYYSFARLMEEKEIYSLMSKMGISESITKKCLENTLKIRDQIEFFDLEQKQKIPKTPLEDISLKISQRQLNQLYNYPTLSWALKSDDPGTKYCIKYCLNSLWEKRIWDQPHLDRLEEEFEVHKFQSEQLDSNFFNYVNVMQWVIETAWSIDCAVGPSRGSASGCLLNYLMDVVQNDPLKYELPFFRYLHKERVTPLKNVRWSIKLGERAQRCA